MKRKFLITFEIGGEDVSDGIIELDQRVIDVVDDEWRSQLYPLHTPEEIAAHIGYNMMRRIGTRLTDLDGWADLSDDLATVLSYPDLDDWGATAQEITR